MSQFPELDEVFRQLKERGVPDAQIFADAQAQGWKDEEISASLESAAVAATIAQMPSSIVEVETTPARKKKGNSGMKLTMVVLAILLCAGIAAGAVVYAYMQGFNPFAKAPFQEATFASQLLAQFESIESGESRIKVSAYTQERESDAQPFSIEALDREEIKARYQRDSVRMERIMDIQSEFQYMIFAAEGGQAVFPESLESYRDTVDPASSVALRGFAPDPLTNEQFLYVKSDASDNYQLVAVFETDEALEAVRRMSDLSGDATVINGRQVTFTKDSPSYVYLSPQPPQTIFELLSSYASLLSDNFALTGEVTALQEKEVDGEPSPRGSLVVDLQGDLDDLTYHFNAEVRTIDETFYFIVNNMPGIFSGLIPKEQWISWAPGDARIDLVDIEELYAEYRESQTVYDRYMRMVVATADATGLFQFKTAPVAERADGQTLYKYDIAFRKESIVPFYTALLEETKKDEAFSEYATAINESNLETLQSEAFSHLFDYYTNNTELAIWVTKEGTPVKIQFTLRVVPDEANVAMNDKQVMFELSYSFHRVNEAISIAAPEGAKKYEEAAQGISGGIMGEAGIQGRDAAIKSTVNNLRAQIEIYGSQSDGSVNYTGACAESTVLMLFDDLAQRSEVTGQYCNATATTWVVAAPLASEGYACADSSGYSAIHEGSIVSTGELCPF